MRQAAVFMLVIELVLLEEGLSLFSLLPLVAVIIEKQFQPWEAFALNSVWQLITE